MGNTHIDPHTAKQLEAYMAQHPELSSKSRAVDRLLATADKAIVLELAVDALKNENERLKTASKT